MAAGLSVIGHEMVMGMLARTVANDQIGHAYLFVGPEHVGKQTVAQAFAQALFCQQPAEGVACGACRACQLVQAGHHPDLLVLDPEAQRRLLGEKEASASIRVEMVRQMQTDLARRPVEGRWKVVVIPDAEAMTDGAANAFLKTLEEPPPHAVLLLTTRQRDLLLPTILSRCQVVTLRAVPLAELERALLALPGVNGEQATLVARLSGGMVGWALRAIREPATLAKRQAALEVLATARRGLRTDRLALAQSLAKDNDPAVLGIWASWWRDVLLVQYGSEGQVVNRDQGPHIAQAAERFSPAQAREALRGIQRALQLLQETNANPQLVWEVLLLRLPSGT